MNVAVFPCENCGSTDLRRSRISSNVEWLRTTMGIYPFRCQSCNHRFRINVWLWSRLAFAKCPQCLRPELSTWPDRNHKLPLWKDLLVTFGAHRYRCVACRKRFVSFRPLQKAAGRATAVDAEITTIPEESEAVPEVESKS